MLAQLEAHVGAMKGTCWHNERHMLAQLEAHVGTMKGTCWRN